MPKKAGAEGTIPVSLTHPEKMIRKTEVRFSDDLALDRPEIVPPSTNSMPTIHKEIVPPSTNSMPTIHKEIEIAKSKDFVWDAIRDVGNIHKRLVPGFVVDCKLEGDSRTVTFANGMVVREIIVSVDDKTCRHAWSARGAPLTHHNASLQVFAEGPEKCRVVWIADLMPNEVVGSVEGMVQQGLEAMKRALENAIA